MNPPDSTPQISTPPVESISTDQAHIVPNTTTLPQMPPPTPKRSNVLLIVLAAILFLGILGTGSYFAYQNYKLAKQPIQTVSTASSPTPTAPSDPTASWILYTNSKYKFSLKHPMEVSVLEENLLGNFDLVFNKGAKNPFIIEVEVKGKIPTGSTGERKIGDVTWSEYLLPATKTTPSIYSLVTLNGDNLYKIVGLYSKDLDPTTFQILTTFKFTDQMTDTSTWKTYTNQKFSYSFKYPGISNGAGATFITESTNKDKVNIGVPESEGIAFSVTVYPNGNIENQYKLDKVANSNLTDLKQVTLNGLPASETEDHSGTSMFEYQNLYLVVNGNLFKLEVGLSGWPQQILSTFKFIQ